jgi:hypothetical protein
MLVGGLGSADAGEVSRVLACVEKWAHLDARS